MTEQMSFDALGPDVRTRAVLSLIEGDPMHEKGREAIIKAIIETAEAHQGVVSNNEMRGRIPAWVSPQLIGAVIGGLTHRGVLKVVGENVSDDRRAGNGGKKQAVRFLDFAILDGVAS